MVKLFVGNLAEAVDSNQLRAIFSQYVDVLECDVLKNFAFLVSEGGIVSLSTAVQCFMTDWAVLCKWDCVHVQIPSLSARTQ